MANKYSRFELKPYQSQYVDPGSTQVAGILRQRYDTNRSNYDMLNRAAGSINTLKGDRHIKEAAMQKVEGDFQRTIEVGNFENAGRVVSDATNDFIGNRGLQLAQQSYSVRQKELEIIDSLRAQGKQVLDFNEVRDTDPKSETFGQVIGHRTDAHSSYYQDPSSGEMVEDVYRPGAEMQLGYTARMQTLLQGIAKSGGKLKEADMEGYLKYMTGVSRNKAYNVVEAALGSYIDTDEGTQDYRRLTEIEGMSDEDAKIDIINRMKGVVEKQIGMTPHYMQAPEGGGPNPYIDKDGHGQIGGGQVDKGTLLDYSDITRDLADLKAQKHPKGSKKDIENKEKIEELKTKKKDYEKQLLSNDDRLSKSVDKGNAILGKYMPLHDIIFSMTTDDNYNPLNMMSKHATGPFSSRDLKGNPSSMWLDAESEREILAAQFDRPNVLEVINEHSGTNYTKKDLPGLKKAAVEYFQWMQEEGNATYKEIDETVSVKQSDMIHFFGEGEAKKLNEVQALFSVYEWEDFNFVFDSEEDREDAKEAYNKAAKAGDEGKADIIKFNGMTIPAIGETGKMWVTINGKRALVTIKDGDKMENVSRKLYQMLGREDLADLHSISQQMSEGNVSNRDMVNRDVLRIMKMQESGADKGHITAATKELETYIDASVAQTLGMTLKDFRAMEQADQEKHKEAWYAKELSL
jgi:hypothetical protein